MTIHLLPNAHLDPVWLWDWREGLNEGLVTVRAVLQLMDEFPELTFMRGESAIYQHIQRTDPVMFKRILKRVEEGRWDVVGGTVIQPDTNMTSTEVLCREFELGLSYFKENLGVRPRVAWLADSFGHSAGLPNIFSAFGIKGFSFTRPQRAQFPLESPAFWWMGDKGSKVLCYRQHWPWYGAERGDIVNSLSYTVAAAGKINLRHVALQFGLGNHGGGPSRRHLREIQKWRDQHPEVEIKFSTLHRFFDDLESELELRTEAIPAIKGEFGFCLRGTYSSVQKFKSIFRKGESSVADAEITRSIIGASTGILLPDLSTAWQALAFNAFHDILPGTSIERAYDDQTAWVGSALHRSQEIKFAALNSLAGRVNTSVPLPAHEDSPTDVPFLIWNPLAIPFRGLVELETGLDYRPLWQYRDSPEPVPVVVYGGNQKPLRFQLIATEHCYMPDLPWRKRVLVPVEIPSLGWTTVRMGFREKAVKLPVKGSCTAHQGKRPRIGNKEWSVEAEKGVLKIRRNSKNFLASSQNLELRSVEDPWGSWGGMAEEKESFHLEKVRDEWTLDRSESVSSALFDLRSRLIGRVESRGWISSLKLKMIRRF